MKEYQGKTQSTKTYDGVDTFTFQPLRDYLASQNISIRKMCKDLGLAERVQVFLNHDTGNISFETLEKIYFYCHFTKISQIVTFIHNSNKVYPQPAEKKGIKPHIKTLDNKNDPNYNRDKSAPTGYRKGEVSYRKLFEKLDRLKISTKTLVKTAKVSTSVISNMRHGGHCTYKKLKTIAEVLCIPVDELWEKVSPNKSSC